MSILLFTVLIAYQAIVAITDMLELKRFKGATITEKERIKFYKEAIIWGWVPIGIIFLFSLFSTINFKDIGFRRIIFNDFTWLNATVFIVAGVIIILLGYQILMYFISEEQREKAAIDIENRKAGVRDYDSVAINLLIPHTLKEKKYFFLVSLTAGICEEIFLRGCVMFLLADIFPNLHIAIVAIISAALFGVFHAYQGLFGIIKTGISGLFFAVIYISTNSIIPGIVLHFFMDFSSAFILKAEK